MKTEYTQLEATSKTIREYEQAKKSRNVILMICYILMFIGIVFAIILWWVRL